MQSGYANRVPLNFSGGAGKKRGKGVFSNHSNKKTNNKG